MKANKGVAMEHNCINQDKINSHDRFIEGNGRPGAKSDLAGMKVRMTLMLWLFGIMASANIVILAKVMLG